MPLPNRLATYAAALAALCAAIVPVVADLDWTSTIGIIGGVGALSAVVWKWLDGWAEIRGAHRARAAPARAHRGRRRATTRRKRHHARRAERSPARLHGVSTHTLPRPHGNGHGDLPPPPQWDLEPREPPSRRDLAGAGLLMAGSAILVALGIWKAAELLTDAL